MRKFVVCVVLAACPCIASATDADMPGFRGITWGQKIETIKDEMIPSASNPKDGPTKLYHRRGENMRLGGAELSDVAYAFYKGEFHSAMLTTEGIVNESALTAAFLKQFGQPSYGASSRGATVWNGNKYIVSLRCNIITHDCTAMFISRDHLEWQRSDEAKAASNAGKDF